MINLLVFLTLLFTSFLNAHEKNLHESQGVQVKKEEGSDKQALQEIAAEYERTVRPFFQAKCFDCHSHQTRYPWYHQLPGIRQWIDRDIREAHQHMDMSWGFPFKGHGSPSEDLESIGEVVNKGTMPPFRYILMHWDARLTDEEKMAILQWVEKSQNKLFLEGNK